MSMPLQSTQAAVLTAIKRLHSHRSTLGPHLYLETITPWLIVTVVILLPNVNPYNQIVNITA